VIDHLRKAQRLFEACLDVCPKDRLSFVERACDGDSDLLNAVCRLLESDARAGEFLSESLVEPRREPEQIGDYRVLGVVGYGGMSTVYLGEGPRDRRVAIKVLRADLIGTEAVERFHRERKILSSLDHERIVPVIDDGIFQESPYLVMPFVHGERIDLYCDHHRNGTDVRLRLLLDVCRIVSHAHRHGIIHRDLKPSNMLIDANGRPHLVDFGIAKILQNRDDTTGWDRFFTLNYASPEHLIGSPVTTSSDVYSLAVVLFQLLVGRKPYDWGQLTREQMLKRMAIDAPDRLSAAASRIDPAVARLRLATPEQMRRRFRGDLDTILAKALDFNVDRRYPTVDAFAADLERYLSGMPVRARPLSLAARWFRYARRQPLVFGAVAVASVSIIVFSIVSSVQKSEALRQERLARVALARAERVTSVLTEIIELADPYRSQTDHFDAMELVDRAAARIDQLDDDPESSAYLKTKLGDIYTRLGAFDKAYPLFRAAAEMHRRSRAQERLAEVLMKSSIVLGSMGRFDEALKAVDESLSLIRDRYGHSNPEAAEPLRQRGRILIRLGRVQEASSSVELSLEVQRPSGDLADLADNLTTLTEINYSLGRLNAAEDAVRESYALRLQAYRRDHPLVAQSLNNLGAVLWAQSRMDEAEACYLEALAIRRRVLHAKHPLVASSLNNLANLYNDTGRTHDADLALRDALDINRRNNGDRHPSVAFSLVNLAQAQVGTGSLKRAETYLLEAVEIYREHYGAQSPQHATAAHSLGDVLRQQGRFGEAESWLTQTLDWRVAMFGCDHPVTASTRFALGRLAQARGALPDAKALFAESLWVRRKALGDHWLTGLTLMNLADVEGSLGQVDSSAMAQEAVAMLEYTLGRDHWRVAVAQGINARILYRSGDAEAARRLLKVWVPKIPDAEGPIGQLRQELQDLLQSLDALGPG